MYKLQSILHAAAWLVFSARKSTVSLHYFVICIGQGSQNGSAKKASSPGVLAYRDWHHVTSNELKCVDGSPTCRALSRHHKGLTNALVISRTNDTPWLAIVHLPLGRHNSRTTYHQLSHQCQHSRIISRQNCSVLSVPITSPNAQRQHLLVQCEDVLFFTSALQWGSSQIDYLFSDDTHIYTTPILTTPKPASVMLETAVLMQQAQNGHHTAFVNHVNIHALF